MQEYHDGQLNLSHCGNPYLLISPRGLPSCDTGLGPGKTQNGVALFTSLQELVWAYIESITHINVAPEALANTYQEMIESHILDVLWSGGLICV